MLGVFVTAPPPLEKIAEEVAHAETAQEASGEQKIEEPKETQVEPGKPKEPIQEQPAIDPNGCEPEQYWAEAAPHECIDKPVKSSSSTASPTTTDDPRTTCSDWKAAAGIPNTHATRTLINNESGCRTSAINPSSGACGIPQAYPCSKLPCPLNDSGAVCQLQWMDNYVKNRYGSWENALAKWHSRCGSAQGCWY